MASGMAKESNEIARLKMENEILTLASKNFKQESDRLMISNEAYRQLCQSQREEMRKLGDELNLLRMKSFHEEQSENLLQEAQRDRALALETVHGLREQEKDLREALRQVNIEFKSLKSNYENQKKDLDCYIELFLKMRSGNQGLIDTDDPEIARKNRNILDDEMRQLSSKYQLEKDKQELTAKAEEMNVKILNLEKDNERLSHLVTQLRIQKEASDNGAKRWQGKCKFYDKMIEKLSEEDGHFKGKIEEFHIKLRKQEQDDITFQASKTNGNIHIGLYEVVHVPKQRTEKASSKKDEPADMEFISSPKKEESPSQDHITVHEVTDAIDNKPVNMEGDSSLVASNS